MCYNQTYQTLNFHLLAGETVDPTSRYQTSRLPVLALVLSVYLRVDLYLPTPAPRLRHGRLGVHVGDP